MSTRLSDSYKPSHLESLSESQLREHVRSLSEDLTAFLPIGPDVHRSSTTQKAFAQALDAVCEQLRHLGYEVRSYDYDGAVYYFAAARSLDSSAVVLCLQFSRVLGAKVDVDEWEPWEEAQRLDEPRSAVFGGGSS